VLDVVVAKLRDLAALATQAAETVQAMR